MSTATEPSPARHPAPSLARLRAIVPLARPVS
jgi:hypothetical protein